MDLNVEICQNYKQFPTSSQYQNSCRKEVDSCFVSKKLMFEIMMEEIKPIVAEKHEIEYRNVYELLAIFEASAVSGFQEKEQKRLFFNRMAFLKYRAIC